MSDISTKKFNLNALRATSKNPSDIIVETVLTTVAVRKPKKGDFFRVHPDEDKIFDLYLLHYGDNSDAYVVTSDMVPHMVDSVKLHRLLLCITRHGTPFLWSLRLPNDERQDSWAESALAIAEMAKTHWVRIASDRAGNAYIAHRALGELGEPEWPVTPFEELIELGFKNRIIDSTDHILYQQLQGLR